MKEPKCSHCGGNHYKINCFSAPRKAIKSSPIKRTYKPPISTKMTTYPSKPKKRLKTAKNSRQSLIKELDVVFSRYIRQKHSVNGVARCVTCGVKRNWRSMDAGHYITRGRIGLRFDERNVFPQCHNCNRYLSGNIKQYKTYLQRRYGLEIIEVLEAQKFKQIKTFEIEALLVYYKKKLSRLS